MLEFTDHERIREIRLSRPPANALDPKLVKTLIDAFGKASNECDAVVLSGQPGMFSGGLDVVTLIELDRPAMLGFWSDFFEVNRVIAASPVPIIAAITGHSPAGGAVMAMFCDYRVMSEGDYRIGLNEVAVGLPVPPTIVEALGRQIGSRLAERLIVRGALLGPADALTAGLVDRVVAQDEVIDHALREANKLTALPRAAMSITRGFARRDLVAVFDTVDAQTVEQITDYWFSEETQKTMHALVARLAGK